MEGLSWRPVAKPVRVQDDLFWHDYSSVSSGLIVHRLQPVEVVIETDDERLW